MDPLRPRRELESESNSRPSSVTFICETYEYNTILCTSTTLFFNSFWGGRCCHVVVRSDIPVVTCQCASGFMLYQYPKGFNSCNHTMQQIIKAIQLHSIEHHISYSRPALQGNLKLECTVNRLVTHRLSPQREWLKRLCPLLSDSSTISFNSPLSPHFLLQRY